MGNEMPEHVKQLVKEFADIADYNNDQNIDLGDGYYGRRGMSSEIQDAISYNYQEPRRIIKDINLNVVPDELTELVLKLRTDCMIRAAGSAVKSGDAKTYTHLLNDDTYDISKEGFSAKLSEVMKGKIGDDLYRQCVLVVNEVVKGAEAKTNEAPAGTNGRAFFEKEQQHFEKIKLGINNLSPENTYGDLLSVLKDVNPPKSGIPASQIIVQPAKAEAEIAPK